MLTDPMLRNHRSLRHAFFTREGGVSEGIYASLNCGLGSCDDPARVRENRSRAMHRLELRADALITAFQVHSAYVAIVEGGWPPGARPQLDGLVTRTRGLCLGILTADCAPVLLADAHAGVIGAAHAGWRGAKAGICAATMTAMQEMGAQPERIQAAIGPCIRQDSYQVDDAFREAFIGYEPDTAALFRSDPQPGHWRFDLPGYVAHCLRAAGVQSLSVLPFDTCADADRFFSFRRTTHAGGGDYGRMLSAIALCP